MTMYSAKVLAICAVKIMIAETLVYTHIPTCINIIYNNFIFIV